MSSEHSEKAGHHGHFAHVLPIPLLVGVAGALLFLTGATVWVTHIDLGATGNLLLAMFIATIKAALVVAIFMHVIWDKPINKVFFFGTIFFVGLFISLTLLDKSETEPDIMEYKTLQAAEAE